MIAIVMVIAIGYVDSYRLLAMISLDPAKQNCGLL